LYAQGDLAGARKLQEQVLEDMSRFLGKEHPSTLMSMLNLAEIRQAEGDFAEAERLRRLAMESRGATRITDDK
jgi:Tetratricopeptide repeat